MEDLRRFEREWRYALDASMLVTLNCFAPIFFFDSEEARDEERRRRQCPGIEVRNVWREVRSELEALFDTFERAHEKYNYQCPTFIASEVGERLIRDTELASERKEEFLKGIEHVIGKYLANRFETTRALITPAVESTKAQIQSLRNEHLAILAMKTNGIAHLQEQQRAYITNELANHLDLENNKVLHVHNRAEIPDIAGVYVITRDKVMYIGESGNVAKRFLAHFSNRYYKELDLVSIIEESSKKQRVSLETDLINAIQPKLNKR